MIGLEDNILILTSLVFIINVIVGVYTKNYTYAILFTLLIITSLVVHGYNSPPPLPLPILTARQIM